jgi:hypothetical protein
MTQARDVADGKFTNTTLKIDSGSDNVNTLLLSDGAADANIVDGFVTSRHHSSSEEPVLMIQGRSTSSENIVLIGGTHNNSTYNTATSIKFFTASGYTNTTPVERMRVLSSGGLTFNGDTATANALSDYEEGTFEPTFTSGAGDFTSVGYNGDTGGRYIKVGNLVYVQGCARINGTLNKSNRASGETLVLGNLPFANSSRSNGDNADSIANVRCPVWGSGDVPDRGIMRNGSNAFSLVQHRSNATSHTITAGDLPSDAMMQFTVMYTTN